MENIRNPADDFNPEEWAQRKQEERAAVYDILDLSTKTVGGDQNELRSFLDLQARLIGLSASNALLVHAQCPEAAELKSFDEWHDKKVSVKGGQTAISILILIFN